jgi:TonB-linked SusC/RagA family outer membrane protein
MLKKLLLGICTSICCLFLSSQIYAQQKTVTGVVTNSKDNAPIPLATIGVKGTKIAAVTGTNGEFSISVPDGKSRLVVSSVGYDNEEVSVSGISTVKVSLIERPNSLNEVIVTGYTSQKRKEITGAVSVVNVKDMKTIPSSTVQQMLQGQASGVQVIGSGAPGENSNVFIRGITSFGNVAPLVVIDGVQSAPGDLSTLQDLNATNIESVQVLKDAQAAIYGARGAAGVILVTTKRGRGAATFTYDGYYGSQVVPKSDPWGKANPQQMAEMLFLAAKNSLQVKPANDPVCPGCVVSQQYGTGLEPVLPDYIKAGSQSGVSSSNPAVDLTKYNDNYAKGDIYLVVPANKTGTDWWDAVFNNAPIQSHTVTAAGGTNKSSFLFAFNYFDQQGTLLNTGMQRYSGRVNTLFSVTPNGNVRVGENLYMFYKNRKNIGNNQEGNPVNTTAWEQPIIPLINAGGGFGGTAGSELGNSSSPYATQTRAADNNNNDYMVQGDAFIEIDFLKNFTVKSLFGGNQDNNYGYYHNYRGYENAENPASNGYGEYSSYTTNWNFTNTLSYSNTFAADHNVKALIGYEALQYTGRNVSGNRINYFSDNPSYLSLNTGANGGQSNSSSGYKIHGTAFLAKLDYAYQGKYLIGANYRYDGNSVFGPNSTYGSFYSVSAGWIVTQENFMKSATWLNNLKIRGSYGILGSISNVPASNQFTAYASSGGNSYYDVSGSGSPSSGFYASSYGNLNTSWEENEILDFGLDATFLRNWDFTFDWYQKKINGLLFTDQAAGTAGVGATLPLVNIGDMQNTGFDLSLGYHGKINADMMFSASANFSHYKNVVVSIPGSAGFFETAYTHNTGPQVRNEQGQAVGAFYGYHIVGIYADAADVAKSPIETDAAPGRFKYQDTDGDGTITDADRTFYGNPNPDFTLGMNINFTYKQFDFSTVLYGVFGNDILNYTRYFQDFWPQFQNAKSAKLLTDSWIPADRSLPRAEWTAVNSGASYPIVENNSYFSTNAVLNDFYNEDGSYFRCKQMSIGYTLAPELLKKVGIQRARVYIQAANLFTITGYTGLDPEVSGSASTFGVDYGNYPNNKTYLVGASFTF